VASAWNASGGAHGPLNFDLEASPWKREGERSDKTKGELPAETLSEEVSIMKPSKFIRWYRILRADHQWSMFQAIRYAL